MIIPAVIRNRGFHKWYERELLCSHGHLVLLLLSVIGALGGLESMSGGTAADRLSMVLSVMAAGAIAVWALRRYLFHLSRAEAVAHQAQCSACTVYGRWDLEADTVDEQGGTRMRVRCRGCGHRWSINC